MGRLPALTPRAFGAFALLGLLAAGCNEDQRPTSAPRERSQVVVGTAAASPPAAAPAPTPSARPAAVAKPRRALCAGQTGSGKPLPKKRLSQSTASGAPALPDPIPTGTGFTWVNFWAAWCAPCKEEIPRLLGWQDKLAGRGFRVAFVSIDDDQRQLEQFLSSGSALRATYWLKEGKEREDWMSAAGLELDPELPVHLLVGPDGRVRCKVDGAVEDEDFPDLVRFVGGTL